jgi:type II secretory pathway component GspD/PulD (secretin)
MLMKNIATTAVPLLLASSLAIVIGCTSSQLPWYGEGPTEKEPEVAEAERLFEQGYLRSFIVASVAPSTNVAVNAGLQELQSRIARRLMPEVLEIERLFENGQRQEALTACNALAEERPDAVGLAQLRARMTRDLSPAVAAAEALFVAGRTQEAITACIDITRKDPEAVGLADLQRRINLRLAEERLTAANKRAEATVDLGTADALGFAAMPQRYRQKQHVMGETNAVVTPLTEMQKALQQPVSLTLENADVNAIIAEIKKSTNINYIADSEIVSTKLITARFENTPLIEMLEYFDKNLDISFSVYSNLIWITQKEPPAVGVPPMKTRVYRLRKGLVGSELGKTAQGASLFKGPEERGRSSSQQQQEQKPGAEGKVGLLEAIERFVPQPEGADFMFDDKVHALVVKNTLDNLALVEELIAAMDLRPLQVLIEARFVTTTVTDLRELGIEWLIDNRGDSRFEPGSLGDTDPWRRGSTRVTPVRTDVLTGVFTGVEDTGGGGASLAYQFLLGDTALKAVLNALEKTGDSRTVVVPRVTTLNNREARFRVGEDISYFEEVETDIMTSGGYNSSESRDNVTYDYDRPTVVETGYSLVVTPSVGADLSAINMVLRPEISSVKEWKKYRLSSLDRSDNVENEPAIEIPTISRQYIETEAVVRSGETVVLGGLVDASKNDEVSGTPWLSKLPLLGYLFKNEDKNESTKNILIFVTATLISDKGEELIPLNDFERYGLEVPAEAQVPDILKAPATP